MKHLSNSTNFKTKIGKTQLISFQQLVVDYNSSQVDEGYSKT